MHLIPALPQAVTDRVTRTSADGLLNLWGYRNALLSIGALVAELRPAEFSRKMCLTFGGITWKALPQPVFQIFPFDRDRLK